MAHLIPHGVWCFPSSTRLVALAHRVVRKANSNLSVPRAVGRTVPVETEMGFVNVDRQRESLHRTAESDRMNHVVDFRCIVGFQRDIFLRRQII